ncbi:CidA/LrgA family protein [Pantoea phytobeneficialis]|uniref:CidA/LrgA family protein n=1 Tax=Pantoea phytobeneficialis TaxID=2052056 RepID=A0AAP9KMW2_9GAMM|nr:CidA/LrgA family protein [Pantoea phytobeneficialis]MDO6405922.1 CidA/LrgA family protein [Pantoea phytobeneficialis]QGR05187.1 murein hydrolase regulator LrgA [Pantoea phytobeneficialis]
MAFALSPRRTDILQRIFVPLQLVLYVGLFIASDKLVGWLHLPLPANVVGMLLLLVLIITRVIPLRWVKAGANWLLAEMLLFFVPAVVAVVNYSDLLRSEGWRICLVIGISTLLVLAATSLVVDRVYRFEMARAARKQAHHE